MSRPKTDAARVIAGALAALGLGGCLAGCANTDLYLDRRDSIAIGSGDAVAANAVEQTVDPWPAYSGDKTIPFNGQKMQAAVERYRTGKVTPPPDPEEFMSNDNQAAQTINNTTVNTGVAPPPTASQ